MNNYQVAAEELYTVREQIRLLKQREEDIVAVFKELGSGVYAGDSHTVIVSEYQRQHVDLEAIKRVAPGIVDQFTETRRYLQVRAVSAVPV